MIWVIKPRHVFKLLAQKPKSSDQKHNDAWMQQYKTWRKSYQGSLITNIIQKAYSKKNTGEETEHKGTNGYYSSSNMLQVHFFPSVLCRLSRICILGSRWTTWELFSADVSDRNKLSGENKYCLHVCIYYTILHKEIYVYKYLYKRDWQIFSF